MRTNTHSGKRGVGAPETKIEITPAMIEAGENAVYSLLGGGEVGHLCSAQALAKGVFEAMSSFAGKKGKRKAAGSSRAK